MKMTEKPSGVPWEIRQIGIVAAILVVGMIVLGLVFLSIAPPKSETPTPDPYAKPPVVMHADDFQRMVVNAQLADLNDSRVNELESYKNRRYRLTARLIRVFGAGPEHTLWLGAGVDQIQCDVPSIPESLRLEDYVEVEGTFLGISGGEYPYLDFRDCLIPSP